MPRVGIAPSREFRERSPGGGTVPPVGRRARGSHGRAGGRRLTPTLPAEALRSVRQYAGRVSVLWLVTFCLLSATQPAAAPSAQPAAERVLVVPFENSRNEPRMVWLSEAAAVLLADNLSARGVAAIRRAERVRAFQQLHLPLTATLSRATVIKVGQLVGATEVVVGSYKLDGERLTVEAHSIRIDVGRLQPHVLDRAPLNDLFALFDRVAGRLSSGGGSASARRPQPPLGAFESYIKGLIAENAATRATFLESAIREDPSFDRAKLALWDVRHEQGDHTAALA